MDVDPVWAGDRRFVAFGRDGGLGAQVADMLAERVAAVATIGNDPARHIWQPSQQRHGVRQLVRLARRQGECHGPTDGVADHAGSGSEAD